MMDPPPTMCIFWRAAARTCPTPSPAFGTPCAANMPEVYGERVDDERPRSMMGADNGFMILVTHEDAVHDH